jgi:hypothetical protein
MLLRINGIMNSLIKKQVLARGIKLTLKTVDRKRSFKLSPSLKN